MILRRNTKIIPCNYVNANENKLFDLLMKMNLIYVNHHLRIKKLKQENDHL